MAKCRLECAGDDCWTDEKIRDLCDVFGNITIRHTENSRVLEVEFRDESEVDREDVEAGVALACGQSHGVRVTLPNQAT